MIVHLHLFQYFLLEHADLVSNRSFYDDFSYPDKTLRV